MVEKHQAICSPFLLELKNSSCEAASVMVDNLKLKKLYICFTEHALCSKLIVLQIIYFIRTSDTNVINLFVIVQLSLLCSLVSTLRVQFLVKMKILTSESHGL